MAPDLARSFRAMNTDVEVVICGAGDAQQEAQAALDHAEAVFRGAERALSRFRPGSDLSRLNASAGTVYKPSPLLFEAIQAALAAAEATGGLFDPAVLNDLLSAGYDRSFDGLARREHNPAIRRRGRSFTWRDIRLDAERSTAWMPSGCSIDLGGIGKGLAVDRASRELGRFTGSAVDAGGDIAVRGRRSDGSPWTVGVADPRRPEADLLTIELSDSAVCTSSTVGRRWQTAAGWQHHIIDPRRGEPCRSGAIAATVVAGSAARAETLAKAALVLGPEAGRGLIEGLGAQGMLVRDDGNLAFTPGFPGVKCVA